MANQIKHGLIGMIAGLLISLGAIALATGTYKEKVDANCGSIKDNEVVLSIHSREINGLNHDLKNNKELLLELKVGQKEMLKKMDW